MALFPTPRRSCVNALGELPYDSSTIGYWLQTWLDQFAVTDEHGKPFDPAWVFPFVCGVIGLRDAPGRTPEPVRLACMLRARRVPTGVRVRSVCPSVRTGWPWDSSGRPPLVLLRRTGRLMRGRIDETRHRSDGCTSCRSS